MKKKKAIIVTLLSGTFCLGLYGQEEQEGYIAQDSKTFPASSCSPDQFTKLVGSYDFNGNLEDYFEDHPDWQDYPTPGVINDAFFEQRNNRLEFEVPSASMAASESWRTWKTPMPTDKSWKIRADCTVPLVWNGGDNPEYQIGVGLFVGKPGGHTVYEIDFSGKADNNRFVLAQNILDRQSSIDPNYVGKEVPIDMAKVDMEVIYCNEDRSLSIYYTGTRVDTQPIDDKGIFNWEIGQVFRVGIMGFSEGPACNSNFLYVDNWEVYE